MARVKRAVNAHKKRRVILERAEGYRGQRSRLYRKAKEQVTHSLVYAYRDRRQRKGDFRRLWIQRINAASRANGLTYNRFIQGLGLAGVEVDRRILAELAVNEPATFAGLVADGEGGPARRHVGAASPQRDRQPGRSGRSRGARRGPRADEAGRPAQERPGGGPSRCGGAAGRARGARARRAERVDRGVLHLGGFGRLPRARRGGGRPRASRSSSSSEQALAAMADTRTPQGVLAVARQAPVRLRDAVPAGARLVVVLDEVHDPGNAGTIIRAADAAGADSVILTGASVDPYNPKVVRSTTGSLFHLRIATGASLAEAAGASSARPASRCSPPTWAGSRCPSLGDALAAPTAWLFGNEAHGLSEPARALADRTVAVPIYGPAESLNLATAAAVCLYASAFAQRA